MLSVNAPSGYNATLIHQGTDPAKDSENPAGQVVTLVKGQADVTYDFGFMPPPAALDDISRGNTPKVSVTLAVKLSVWPSVTTRSGIGARTGDVFGTTLAALKVTE